MDQFRFTAKALVSTAKTVAPMTDRKFATLWPVVDGTITAQEDSFFAVESAAASADNSFSDLLAKKSN